MSRYSVFLIIFFVGCNLSETENSTETVQPEDSPPIQVDTEEVAEASVPTVVPLVDAENVAAETTSSGSVSGGSSDLPASPSPKFSSAEAAAKFSQKKLAAANRQTDATAAIALALDGWHAAREYPSNAACKSCEQELLQLMQQLDGKAAGQHGQPIKDLPLKIK